MLFKFTMDIKYSGQDFDEVQSCASQLTEADRKAGLRAPAYGYSLENVRKAEAMRREQVDAHHEFFANPENWRA